MSERRKLRSSALRGNCEHSLEHCNEKCVRKEQSLCRRVDTKMKADCLIVENVNPLKVPLLCGWNRRASNCVIYYFSPCQQRLKDLQQISDYLHKTKSKLSIEQFHFGFSLKVDRPQTSAKPLMQVADVTGGCENIPVPLVDEFNKNPKLPSFKYSNTRIFSPKITLDDEFSSCCDCTDNCRDTNKCSCVQLTINETKLIKAPSEYLKRTKGYQNKRLLTLYPSGIFECNKRCKCNAKCQNRLVQNGIKLRLQVFKTQNKGWGLRCLDDIPKGTFICTYSGEIHNEDDSDKLAKKQGDEYVAELDYIQEIESVIEILERNDMKEGYESDIETLYDSDEESDSSSSINSSSSEAFSEDESDSDDSEVTNCRKRNVVNESKGNCNKKLKRDTPSDDDQYVPLSKYLGEKSYRIDAKMRGNIGRFLNHSCDPNCRIQSVFIDNHDPRFPVLAFFAIKQIVAYTELTWNYWYLSLPDTKKQVCVCGAKNCEKRILF